MHPFAQQEVIKFTDEVDQLQTSLQKVSRLGQVLIKFMELLPEDFEDMEKDRIRYGDELQLLQNQIDDANKYKIFRTFFSIFVCIPLCRAEERELEKLRRKLTLNEEVLFSLGEEIVSTNYRIKEKSDVLKRLQSMGRM